MNKSSMAYLILAVFSWLALCAVLFTVVSVDGTGDRDIFLGLRWILAGLLVCATWACLGGLLFIARDQKFVSGWALNLWIFS